MQGVNFTTIKHEYISDTERFALSDQGVMDEQLSQINAKLDTIIRRLDAKPNEQKYLTAKDVGRMTGLDHRTILNRSNLEPDNPRYIPSLRFGSRRKYFERKVIERLFKIA